MLRLRALACTALVLATALCLATPQSAAPATPQALVKASVAELGVELPVVGGRHWLHTTHHYFTPQIMADIRDNLHATYVRTGWTPDERSYERIRWFREDKDMDTVCASGLKTMIIVPTPSDDPAGEEDLIADTHDFFARYTLREPGCIRYVEIVNEGDLSINGFSDVRAYAAFYARIAPVVSSFDLPIITTGTSGMDLPWTATLSALLREASPPPSVDGFGFHPYGVSPEAMAQATMQMRQAAGGARVYVTEIGQDTPAKLYETIVTLAHVTPAITIYEYMAQYGEDPRYGLRDHPALYAAMQRAWVTLHQVSQQPNE